MKAEKQESGSCVLNTILSGRLKSTMLFKSSFKVRE